MTAIEIDYTLNDNSTDGVVEIYRSETQGNLGTLIATRDPSDPTVFVDEGLTEAKQFYYTIRRVTDHASADSAQDGQYSKPLTPDIDTITTNDPTPTADISWIDYSNLEAGYSVRLGEDGNTPAEVADLAPDSTSYTTSELDRGSSWTTEIAAYVGSGSNYAESTDSQAFTFTTYSGYWATAKDFNGNWYDLTRVVANGPTYEHTAHHDFSITPINSSVDFLDKLYLADIEVFNDTQRLFKGRVERVREDTPAEGLSQLYARGKTLELTREAPASPPTYTSDSLENVLDDYYANYANVDNYTVTPSTPEVILADDGVLDVDLTAEWQDVTTSKSATDPLYVPAAGDRLQLAQTAFTRDAQSISVSGGASVVSVSGFTNTEGVRLDAVGHTLTQGGVDTDYDIPIDDFEWWIRYRAENTSMEFDCRIDGTTYSSGSVITVGTGSPDWYQIPKTNSSIGDITAGSHTFEIEVTGSVDAGDLVEIDVVAPLDSGARFGGFNYSFPSSLNGFGYLDGPELGPPDGVVLELDSQTGVYNIQTADITATATDTTNGFQLAASLDATRDSFEEINNSLTGSINFSDNDEFGTTITPRLRLSSYGSDTQLSTPSINDELQDVQSLVITADKDARAVVDNITLDGNHYENIQRLHNQGDWRFVSDPTTDTLDMHSFRTGDVTKTLDKRVLNDSQERDVRGFANKVTVIGRIADGADFAEEATAEDSASIATYGEYPLTILRTDVVTEEEVKNAARNELQNRVNKIDPTGQIETTPDVVLPGYSYTVSEWGQTVALTRTDFRASSDEADMTLDFSADTDTTAQLSSAKKDVQQAKENFTE